MNTLDLIIWKKKQQEERERQQYDDNRVPLYVPDYNEQRKENENENHIQHWS